MSALDLQRFRSMATGARGRFAAAVPFPHLVLDDFVDPAAARAVLDEFTGLPDSWTYYHHVNEKKRGFADLARMGPATRALIGELQSDGFLAALEALTGIRRLIADPELDGGGLHETPSGGFLNVHTDFLSHTTRLHWSRQVNLLLFLNPGWQESYGGGLEFWDADARRAVQRIAPIFNRCVIFRTGNRSFHGAPSAVDCPPGTARRSLALYYFRNEGRACALRPTHYVPRPSDAPVKRALIRVDQWALHAYSALKRYTPFGDRVVSAILRRF
jgi:2-oxoglutarate-Fe(II)-dependent oxygenase superfamily protein